MSGRPIKVFSAAILAALLIAKADAADYAAGFSIDADANRNDNIRLVQDDKTAVTKYGLTPRLTVGVHTETTKVDLDSTFDFNRYDKSEFNSNDQNITFALSRDVEHGSLGLRTNYVSNSTLTSELLTSGRIGTRADRATQYSLSPNWTYTFTEANLIQLNGTYTRQNYQNTSYIGYRNTGGELQWIHAMSDRWKFFTGVTYSDYLSDGSAIAVPPETLDYQTTDPNDPGVPDLLGGFIPVHRIDPNFFGSQSYATRTRTANLQIGSDYQLTERSLLSARIGRSRDDTSYSVQDLSNVCGNPDYLKLVEFNLGLPFGGAICESIPHTVKQGLTAEINWTWNSELQQFGLNVTKATQPTSNGYAVDAIQLASNWSYQLSELDKFLVNLSMSRNRAIDKKNSRQNTSIADRDYGSATLQYQRQLGEYWFLNASFQFSGQKYTQIDYRASSRVYSLGLSYRPQQWHWAR